MSSFFYRFLDVVTQQFGSLAASTVRDVSSEQYPLLLVVIKNRSALEVRSVLQGQHRELNIFIK